MEKPDNKAIIRQYIERIEHGGAANLFDPLLKAGVIEKK